VVRHNSMDLMVWVWMWVLVQNFVYEVGVGVVVRHNSMDLMVLMVVVDLTMDKVD